MYPTIKEIMENLKDRRWVTTFINSFLADEMSVIEKKYRYRESDRQGVPVESEVAHFEKRGVILWAFDDHWVTKGDRKWKEVVLFEQGEFSLIEHSLSEGTVKADFEYDAVFRNHETMVVPLSEDNLELCKEKISEKLLLAAKRMAWFEHHELHERWDNLLA